MTTEDINLAAFLKFIRFAENTRDDDGVYFLLYGGVRTFTDVSKHPDMHIKAWGRTSTAAGAYQILYKSWREAKTKGIVRDFSKPSQDAFAIWKLRTRNALPYVKQGDIEKAIPLLREEWTSMPGKSKMTMKVARRQGPQIDQLMKRLGIGSALRQGIQLRGITESPPVDAPPGTRQ